MINLDEMRKETTVDQSGRRPARVAGSIFATVLALAGLVIWAGSIDSNLRYGAGGVALPFALFWLITWLILCWSAAGILMGTFGKRARLSRIVMGTTIAITLIGIASMFVGPVL